VRRRDPDRIREARRAGLHARMTNAWQLTPERASELLDGWDAEAEARGLSRDDARYASEQERWIKEQAGR
jgi:hypothetical protein